MTLEDPEEIEELQLDEKEFELIYKRPEFQFSEPVVTINDKSAYFNTLATVFVPDRIKWYTTSDYVIGLPADKDDKNGYVTKKAFNGAAAFIPHKLRVEKKLKRGYYKVYKYKEGFAFKRYEQYGKRKNG